MLNSHYYLVIMLWRNESGWSLFPIWLLLFSASAAFYLDAVVDNYADLLMLLTTAFGKQFTYYVLFSSNHWLLIRIMVYCCFASNIYSNSQIHIFSLAQPLTLIEVNATNCHVAIIMQRPARHAHVAFVGEVWPVDLEIVFWAFDHDSRVGHPRHLKFS